MILNVKSLKRSRMLKTLEWSRMLKFWNGPEGNFLMCSVVLFGAYCTVKYQLWSVTYVALWDPESTQFQCYLRPSPRDWKTLIHFNVVLTVFWLFCRDPEICGQCGKLLELHWNVSMSFNRGEKVLNSIEIWWTQEHRGGRGLRSDEVDNI